jgi:predicted metal-binding membrane protein
MTLGGINWTGHRAMTLVGLFLATAAAWLALAAIHGEAGLALDTVAALCLQVGGSASIGLYPPVLAMWLLMSVAMMLPTALPTIDLYVRLSRRMEEGRTQRIVLFIAGYVVAWGGFGALAAAAQIGLRTLPAGIVAPALGAGGLLVLAGAYQLSPLKQSCLDLCRNPMLFFMSRWRETLGGTLSLGFRHGLICIGCCWALMLLMFVGGTMNLVWMALLGLAMLAEKMLPGAGTWGRAGGVLMIAAGTATIGSNLI